MIEEVAKRLCPGHDPETQPGHDVCLDSAQDLLGYVLSSQWFANRLVEAVQPTLDLCDRWDVFSKSESPTTHSVREAIAQGLLGYDPNIRLEQD